MLSDVSSATPIGVSASDIRLSPEQGLTFQGNAKPAELVNAFQKNLGDTKMFRNIKVNRTESNAEGGVEFNLTADVIASSTHLPVKPAMDFAEQSLSMRMHGVETSGQAPESPKDSAGGNGRRERRADSRGADRDGDAEPRRPSTPSDAMPPVVTDEEIKKMDRATANRAWVARKVYVQKNPTLDPAVKQRLQDEEAKIRTHASTAPAAAAGGGS
jgi:hypothetical protein